MADSRSDSVAAQAGAVLIIIPSPTALHQFLARPQKVAAIGHEARQPAVTNPDQDWGRGEIIPAAGKSLR
jgi:hypothetical protein